MTIRRLHVACSMPVVVVCLAFLAGVARAATDAAKASDSANPYLQESAAQRDARMKWFRDARFGMFIHWGLYSVAGGQWEGKPTPGAGEWISADLKIPMSQYSKLVGQFNPVKFDARQWVRIAKDAGMKYIVITTKHHDGFAIYPSAASDWSMKSTPFGRRDPLKELARACEAEGLKLCFYHSIMDWHHPDYAPRPAWNDAATDMPDFERYVQFLKDQLKELLTGYGPIGILWFDGQWENSWNFERGVDLHTYVRSLQSDIIINNRVGQDRKGIAGTAEGQERIGDYGTPEQHIPVTGYGAGVDWETCMTMNGSWGFKAQDQNWKSTQTLVRNLIDIASKGGNYLLNVGPTGEGLIPEPSIGRLAEIGQWMKINGEAIYATTASPFPKQLPWGRCTQKQTPDGTMLYLHVFDWPADGQLLVPGLKNAASKALLLADAQKSALDTKASEDGLLITLPKTAPDSISSTVVVQVPDPLKIERPLLAQAADGSIALPAAEAILHGKTFKYEVGGPLDDIGYWSDPADWAQWEFKVAAPGKFTVVALIAAPASSRFDVALGEGQTLRCAAPGTGNYLNFQLAILGTVEVPSAGRTSLSIRPVKEGWQPMNLKSVNLIPEAPRD